MFVPEVFVLRPEYGQVTKGCLFEPRRSRFQIELTLYDLACAKKCQRSISARYDKFRMTNSGWIGDVLLAQGDRPGALAAYRKVLGIFESLASSDRSNAELQRDLSVTHERIGEVLLAQAV